MEPAADDLTKRDGLPKDLRWLFDSYPRESWQSHRNMAGMASFWLQRHDGFRAMGRLLTRGIADCREGLMRPTEFAQWFAPRLDHFLGNLDGHHNIEDSHYFPIFARAEPRLRRGFEILDRDHHLIHESLEANAEAANAFIRALSGGEDERRFAADAYGSANEKLVAMLTRHLEDEEDLIVPLMLDRGDQALGID